MSQQTISKNRSKIILDSRGNPTVEAEVTISSGVVGWAAVPSVRPPAHMKRWNCATATRTAMWAKACRRPSRTCTTSFAPKLVGMDVTSQREIDYHMLAIDGTADKSKVGANGILAVSLAVANAAAKTLELPLYRYIGGVNAHVLPVPMMNVINGGKHADNNISSQEFMIMPVGAPSFAEGLRWGAEVFHTPKSILHKKGLSTSVGDEGGFAPNFSGEEEALETLMEAISKAGFVPGKDFMLAMDAASTEMFDEAKKAGKEGSYLFWKTGRFSRAATR
ncbi:MAG: hypothetical protein R2881_06730 [Eubacteriales bacterium]